MFTGYENFPDKPVIETLDSGSLFGNTMAGVAVALAVAEAAALTVATFGAGSVIGAVMIVQQW